MDLIAFQNVNVMNPIGYLWVGIYALQMRFFCLWLNLTSSGGRVCA